MSALKERIGEDFEGFDILNQNNYEISEINARIVRILTFL